MGALALVCTGVGALLLLMALAGCGFAVHAGRVLGRYRAPCAPPPPPGERPAVTLVKPLYGTEPGLEAALRSFLVQDYDAPVELRLGVQRPDDPVLPLARALAADPAVRLVEDAARHGTNAKVSNLVNIACAAPLAELVVQSDSDIAVGPDYLARLAAALAEPGVGLVSCLYAGAAAGPGRAARLGAMGVSYQTLPMFAVGVALGATPAMGSTLALRRETLEAIGGFAAVKDVLADDYELGARVRALGLKTVVPPMLVVHRSGESTLGELWRHELRWSKTVADIDRAGHLGSVVTHPIPLAVIGWLLTGLSVWGLVGLALAVVARLWLKSRVDAVVGATTGPWWLMPQRDMLSLAVFVAALFARRVDWRGASYHVGRDGEITPV